MMGTRGRRTTTRKTTTRTTTTRRQRGWGQGRGWDRQRHDTTKTAAHNEGDNKGGTITEGAGDGDSTVRRGTQKRAQETSTTSLGP
jgi:hypothetical protein